MNIKWKQLGLSLLASSSIFLIACSDESENTVETIVDGEEIELANGPWESEIASTTVIGTVLEDVGYDVTLTTLDAAVIWEALVSNNVDAQVGAWQPQTSAPYFEEYGDQVDDLGLNLEGAALGLVVPTYMEDVNSIEDLTDEAGQVITGIEAGSSVVGGANDGIEVYDNLDGWTVQTSSAGAMATELDTAYANEEEIIVTGWSPHWKFQAYDLKYLEDPQGVFGDEENIGTITRLGLDEEHPVAYSILENFYWEVEDMESVMLDIQEGSTAEQAARSWVDDNQDKVSEWLEDIE